MGNKISTEIPNEVIAYALAKCECLVEKIAADTEQPEPQLREWMGILLLTKGTGIVNNLSSLRRKASQMDKTTRKMAVVKHTHRKTSRTPSRKRLTVHKWSPAQHAKFRATMAAKKAA